MSYCEYVLLNKATELQKRGAAWFREEENIGFRLEVRSWLISYIFRILYRSHTFCSYSWL